MPVSPTVAFLLLAPAVEPSSLPEASAEPVPVEAPTDTEASSPAASLDESPEPSPSTPDPTTALEPAPAPIPSSWPAPNPITPAPAPADPEPSGASVARPFRRGALVGLSLGYLGCITDSCRDESSVGTWRYRGGPVGQLELGYRAGRIAPSLSIAMGGGPMKYGGGLEGVEGTMRFLDVAAGVMVFPARKGRFDPFFGLRFGYARAREQLAAPGTDIEGEATYSRYGLKLSVGLGFYVLPTLSIGPRFDLTLPVGGNVCSGIREGERSNIQCFDASSFTDGARHQLPRWWSFSFGMHLVLPSRGSSPASRSR